MKQEPCDSDSWLIIGNQSKPICEPLPGNCTVDQVYWSPDPAKIPEECHVIGQRGPCSIDQVISRDVVGLVSCVVPVETKTTEPKAKVSSKKDSKIKLDIKTKENEETNTEIDPETNTEVSTNLDETKPEPIAKKESKKEVVQQVLPSPWDRPGCPLGSYRSQTNKCSKQFP